jgi:hypothetical protein
MARQKSPKKANDENAPVVTGNVPVPASGNTAIGAVAAAPALESIAMEPKTTRPAAPKPKNGKPEIVKTDSRANLVPINIEDEIRRLAYLLSERRGFAPGHEAEDWMNAEREIRERYHQQSA